MWVNSTRSRTTSLSPQKHRLDLVRRMKDGREEVVIEDATRKVRKQIKGWRLRKEPYRSLPLVFLFPFPYPYPFRVREVIIYIDFE